MNDKWPKLHVLIIGGYGEFGGRLAQLMHNTLHGPGTLRSKKRLPNLTKLTTVLHVLAKAITPFGNDHGGMLVELTGPSADKNHSALQHCEKSGSAMVWEQFGLLKFLLHLPVENGVMQMNVIKGMCLGIPIPRALLPLCNTSEYAANNTMHFSVEIVAPFKLGLIVHYQGWLK